MPTDLSIEILKSIHDEIRATNGRLDQTNGRLDQTNERLEHLREELSQRIVHSEIRTATALTELAGSVREMTGVLKSSIELRPRVERCEQNIAELREELHRVSGR